MRHTPADIEAILRNWYLGPEVPEGLEGRFHWKLYVLLSILLGEPDEDIRMLGAGYDE